MIRFSSFRLIAILTTFIGIILSSSPTHADLRKMQEAYQMANDLFDQKNFAGALRYFEIAYKNLPEKGLDYARNELRYFLGICHYKLGNFRKADAFLTIYLRNNPKPERKKEVEGILKKIRPKIPKRKIIVKKPKETPFAPPSLSYAVVGAGAAILIAGVITGILAKSTMQTALDKYENRTFSSQAKEITNLVQSAQTQSIASNAMLGLGSATLLVGGAMMLSKKSKTLKKAHPFWLGLGLGPALSLVNESSRLQTTIFTGYRLLPLWTDGAGLGIGLQLSGSFGDELLHLDVLPTFRFDMPTNALKLPISFFARLGIGGQYAQTKTCSAQKNETDPLLCNKIDGMRFLVRFSSGLLYSFNKQVALIFEPLAFSLILGDINSAAYSLFLGIEINFQ